jgi:hypothetical protein
MEDTYLKITQDTGTSFSRKRESRLQSFAWIPARTTLGRDDGTILCNRKYNPPRMEQV